MKQHPWWLIYGLSFWVVLSLLLSPLGSQSVLAEGSGNLNTNGGKRALTEWRIGTTAGLYRRTFLRVYARAGEQILMGSSAVGVGQGDIVVYRESQITSSQIAPAALASITPAFQCSVYRQTNPGAGELRTRAQEQAGPLPNTGGYTPCVYTAPATETYWVAMYGPDGPNGNADGQAGTIDTPVVDTNQRSGVSMWDITVRSADGNTTYSGRVFVDYLAQISGGNGDAYKVYSTLYAVTQDGFIYKVDLRGLDPYGFIFYGNRVGFLDPDGKTPLYHDLMTNNNLLNNPFGGVILAPATAKLFFSMPDAALPPEVLPTPVTPSISTVVFHGTAGGNDSYVSSGGVFEYTGNVGGIMEIVVSRDGTDFEPTNPNNRVLRAESAIGVNTLVWDGLDNAGQPFPTGTDYPFRVVFHAGEYHFPMLDVENSREGGPTIQLLNPLGGTCPWATCYHAFYDDRGYRVSTGVVVGTIGQTLPGDTNAKNPPSTNYSGATGFDTRSNQRSFGDGTGQGFGNWKGLDLWTYYPVPAVYNVLDIIPVPQKDLRLSKTHSSDFVVGSTGSFTLKVQNMGTETITGTITVTDTLPTGLTLNAVSGTDWTCSSAGQTIVCVHANSGGLAPGATLPLITLSVNVEPAAAPVVTNTAVLANENDTNSENNTASDAVNVKSTDLRVTKTASTSVVAPGDLVTFTITVENLGPMDAHQVQLTETMPESLILVNARPSQGNFDAATGVWTLGSLPYGNTVTLTVVARVDASISGTRDLTNSVALSGVQEYDLNSANNNASATIQAKPSAVTLRALRAQSVSMVPLGWLLLVGALAVWGAVRRWR